MLFDGVRVSAPEFPDEPVDYTAPCGTHITQAMLVEICKTKTQMRTHALHKHKPLKQEIPSDRILFGGALYPVKEWDGYRFAPESLLEAMTDSDGLFTSTQGELVDESIAYYFPDDPFNRMTPQELSQQFELHL